MIKNYFKVAIRYFARNKGFTAINVLGLAIGISCCMLITLFVRSEWSYDRFHSNADRIYRAWLHEKYEGQQFTNTITPIPLGPVLQANVPEVESVCRVYAFNTLVELNNARYNESITMVDSNFFRFFDFTISNGSRLNAFTDKNSMVLSEEMSKKYFGTNQSIGRQLQIQLGQEKVLFTVSAVARAAPQESTIRFGMLIPHANDKYLFSERARTSGWTQVYGETYVLAREGKTGRDIEAKMPALAKMIAGDNYVAGEYNVHFQPITDIHLDKDLPAGILPVSDPAYSYILGTIGILILLIACVNFVTLSVGRSTTRALEVGIRKVMGAARPQLIRQFWGEALLLVFVSFAVAAILSFVVLKPFNAIADRELAFLIDGPMLLLLMAIILLVGLVAGIYPAIVLSAFSPAKALKGRLQSAVSIGFFRKALISGQFVASIALIIATLVVGRQLNFLRTKDLGYSKEHVVIVSTNKPRAEGFPIAERLKTELANIRDVISASTSMFSFSEPGWANLGYRDDKDLYRNFRMNAVDADFVTTMELQLVRGRNFIKGNSADVSDAMLINETLAREYGWSDPIGKRLPGNYQQQVIGVVKDFHFESLHSTIQPVALVMKPDSMFRNSDDVNVPFSTQPRVNVRMAKGDISAQLSALKAAWNNVAPGQDFDYRFLDESLAAMYRNDQRMGSMVRYASGLSIFIACMGLFGLATLVVTRRTKEIGIRKVLGADVRGLVALLSKDFVLLVLLAAVIAAPLSWWAMSVWLKDFAYRIPVEWWVFVLAAVAALTVAVVTVSVQAVKAAMANPVKSLRTE